MMETQNELDHFRTKEVNDDDTIVSVMDVESTIQVANPDVTITTVTTAAESESITNTKHAQDTLLLLQQQESWMVASLRIVVVLLIILTTFNFHRQARYYQDDDDDEEVGNFEYNATIFFCDIFFVTFISILLTTTFWMIVKAMGLSGVSWTVLKKTYWKTSLIFTAFALENRCFSNFGVFNAFFSTLIIQICLSHTFKQAFLESTRQHPH
jgi:hypothetical protein